MDQGIQPVSIGELGLEWKASEKRGVESSKKKKKKRVRGGQFLAPQPDQVEVTVKFYIVRQFILHFSLSKKIRSSPLFVSSVSFYF